jgi:hypothetical protein
MHSLRAPNLQVAPSNQRLERPGDLKRWRRERGTIVRSRRSLNCGGRPLKLIVRSPRSVQCQHQPQYPYC